MKNRTQHISITFILLLISTLGFSQVLDDFSDGDFTVSPTWSGSTGKFIVNASNQLQSNGSSSGDGIYLTTPNSLIDSVSYDFYLKLDFNPTATSNFVKIYLVSDQADLTTAINGYYLRIGETGSSDTLELWRQDGFTDTKILTGNSSFGSTVEANIRVTRDELGNWSLYTDHALGSNYTLEGSAFDNTHTASTHFGWYCEYSTSSRFDQYYLDNVNVNNIVGDTAAPQLDSLVVISDVLLDLFFNEPVNRTIAENTSNYSIDNGISSPSSITVDGVDSSIVHLALGTSLQNGETYSITITNMEDTANNAASIITDSFLYFIATPANAGDVVINEIFPDPDPQIGLPDAEFVELFNASNELYSLENWVFANSDKTQILPELYLNPGSFVILCSKSDTALFSPYGDVIGLNTWTALTNGGDSLTLVDNFGNIIDIVEYSSSWYNDAVKDDGGYSLEKINPNPVCDLGGNNWNASNDPSGGTPGSINSIFDNTADTIGPNIISVSISGDTLITVLFDEVMDETSLNSGTYTFDSGINVSSSSSNNEFTGVEFVLSSAPAAGYTYGVTVTGVTDCSGNAIDSNIFSFTIPYTAQIGDVIINEIMADPNPTIVLPEAEFVELYNTTDKTINLKGFKLNSSTILYGSIAPNGYAIVTSKVDTLDFAPYGTVVGLSTSSTFLTNSGALLELKNDEGTVINQVEYSESWYGTTGKEDGGWSLELINPFSPCSGANNWAPSESFDGATPGEQNSVFDTLPDTTPPQFTDVQINGINTVVLYFDEPLDTNLIGSIVMDISPSNSISSVAVYNSLGDQLIVTLATPIISGTTYFVQVANQSDCIGNINSSATVRSFEKGELPAEGDLFITEIFPDPSPIVGLPEAEFVELYNASNKKLDLSYVELNGKSINSYLLEPGAYVVVCDDGDTALFSAYSNVAFINSWISLTNAGMQLKLTDTDDNLLDQVNYTDDWYNNNDKDNGGWTLEKINPNSTCNTSTNWSASIDLTGGTPGKVNSIYSTDPDTDKPFVTRVVVVDTNQLYIEFSEGMSIENIVNGSYTFENDQSITLIDADSVYFESVILTLNDDLLPGEVHYITIDSLQDCPGNQMDARTFKFVLPQLGEDGDLIINEILFNPFTGGEDFVEVYNNSDKYIDIGRWYLANFEDDSISNIKSVASSTYIINPNEYFVLTKDSTAVKNNYPLASGGTYLQMATLPTYSNDEGTVILLNELQEVADRIDYNDDMHFPILNSTDGVSLERIDFNRPSNDETNWHSASEMIGFASPGYQNSQFQPAGSADDVLTIEPEIFSPDGDGYNDIVTFTYELNGPGYVGNIRIYDGKGRLIRQLMNNEFLSPSGSISWDGVTDNADKARIGIYVVYGEFYNEAGDIVKVKKPCVVATQL